MVGAFLAGTLGLSLAQKINLPQGPRFEIAALDLDTAINSFRADTTAAINNTTVISNAANASVVNTATEITGLFEKDASSNNMAPRLNPRAVSFVEDYMDRNTRSLQDMKGWALPYFNMMDGIMVQNGLPRELKYLAVIESKLKSGATSWAGAVGPWQLMRGTAIALGLTVNQKVDERRNYVKSTHAAARYLKDLYGIYGDWLLVIASYNAGPGSVQRAIAKSGSRNFWDLQYYLPAETRAHVKKFIGTHYVFEGQGGLTTLTKAETKAHYGKNLYAHTRNLSQEELANAKTQQVSGKYQSAIIAKHISMDLADFHRFNPEFDKMISSSATGYEMKLPVDKMDLFNANKYLILQESVQQMLSGASISLK